MFDPLRAFKKMHHDKLIEGANRFAPCECVAFVYTKIDASTLQWAMTPPIEHQWQDEINGPPRAHEQPSIQKLYLRRVCNQYGQKPFWPDQDGYIAYVLTKEDARHQLGLRFADV